MHEALAAAFATEMRLAGEFQRAGDLASAFAHLERAHILGQRHTGRHLRSHLGMLRIGWRRRDAREVAGQLARLVAAALFSKIWIPVGNTGGANVSAMRPMPVPPDLRRLLGLADPPAPRD
jgi:hypothetical protein